MFALQEFVQLLRVSTNGSFCRVGLSFKFMPQKRKNRKKKNLLREYLEKEGPMNIHHIICRSRGGGNDPSNTVLINVKFHRNFHKVFANALPNEILDILVHYYWGGKISIVEDYIESKKSKNEWETD